MTNEFLAAPARGRVRLVAAGIGTVLVLGAGVVIGATLGGQDTAEPAAAAAAATVGASPTNAANASAAAASASPTIRTPLQLVRGARLVSGVSVGYPHTTVGAVSAAVEYTTQVGSSLDLDRVAQVAEAIAHPPAYGGDPAAAFVAGARDIRRYLGLPTSGPVPQGASSTFGPMAYQVRDERADEVTVLLMSYLTMVSAEHGMEQRLILVPTRMVWDGADWKTAKRPEGSSEYLELRRKPGTPEATAAGWLDFLTP
ncbi:MAG: hypothetical protein JXA67_22550 [Micromonosporaceae bacterium]|nr:hypothetical protein [Micromonosporaceae bacterium]